MIKECVTSREKLHNDMCEAQIFGAAAKFDLSLPCFHVQFVRSDESEK